MEEYVELHNLGIQLPSKKCRWKNACSLLHWKNKTNRSPNTIEHVLMKESKHIQVEKYSFLQAHERPYIEYI